MKHSEMLNLNLPEDNDLINVGHLSGNFEKIDSAFQTLPIKQEESKTDIDVMACPPYWTMHNATDEDIVYIDHNFFDEEFTLEAGQTITNEIEEPVNIRISSEVTIDYTWFIPASEAFSGGGGGGTSDYNKLNNLPTINNVEIKNNKTADDLGLVAKENGKGLSTNDFSNAYKSQLDGLDDALDAKLNANSVGAAGGVAELGSDGKVPSSQLPDPVAQKEYRIAEEASTSYAKVYKLQQKNGETWSDISGSEKINIPKDMVVESGSVKECAEDNVPVSGYKKGDKYIDLVIANKADAHIYINVKDLIDNKAEGIQYSNTTSKLEATNVQSAIDEIAETLKDKVDETELSSVINEVEKKQNKTFVEAVDSETSVVTVPENTTFAAVSKISGKTHKTVNLFDIKSVASTATIISNTEFAYTNRTDTFMSGYFKPNTRYTISAYVKNANTTGNLRFRVYYTDGTNQDVLQNASVTEYTFLSDTTQNGKTIDHIGYYYGSSGSRYVKELQIQEGAIATPYEPYGELWNTPVKSVVSTDKSGNKTTVSVPKEILNLPDYGCSAGDAYNWVDFENMVYHHRVGSVDLGDLVWTQNFVNYSYYNFLDSAKKVSDNSVVASIICSDFNTMAAASFYKNDTSNDKSIGVSATNYIIVKDVGNVSVSGANYAKLVKGVMAYYELATEELIDISNILPPLECEPNGTIEFVNEHNLDVPNKVIYQKGMV